MEWKLRTRKENRVQREKRYLSQMLIHYNPLFQTQGQYRPKKHSPTSIGLFFIKNFHPQGAHFLINPARLHVQVPLPSPHYSNHTQSIL